MSSSRVKSIVTIILALILAYPVFAPAQVTKADYERAAGLRAKYSALALNIVDRGGWIGKSPRYWYRKSVAGGAEYWIADAAKREKAKAFDHAKLAAGLAAASGEKVEALSLPFFTLTFAENGRSVEFAALGARWSCDLSTYACKKLEGPGPRGPRDGGMTMWERGPAPEAASKEAKASPDGKWEAFIRNYNVCLRDKAKKQEFVLSRDGSEGNYYTFGSIAWAPDSKKLAVMRLRRGYHRVIQYVESSPADQLQPKYHSMEYAKPGDALDIERPVLFPVDAKAGIEIDDALFADPYELSDLVWRKDGRAFTFEYNQRGHQVYRVIEVDGDDGRGPGRRRRGRRRRSSTTAARSSATTSPTAARSSGCRSATAGTISTSTTARPARSRTRSRKGSGSSAASTRWTKPSARSGSRPAASSPARTRISSTPTGSTSTGRGSSG